MGATANGCGAVRLGDVHVSAVHVSAVHVSDVGALPVPFCVAAPLRRPVWIGAGDPEGAVPVVASLVLRLLAATPSPAPELDVVDLAALTAETENRPAPAGVVVLSDFGYGIDLAACSRWRRWSP